jgi:hypothetical protein
MSLGAPLGVDITGNSAQAEQALDNVGKKLDQVKTKAREATLATKDMNAEMAKQLRTGAIAARGTAGAAGLSAIGGGMQAGGVMGGLAAAAGIAGTVLTVLKRFSDLSEESARRRLSYEQEITDAAEKAKEARGASAERGLGQEQAYRRALFAGGPNAIARADKMIASGVDPAEAYAAAADTQVAATGDKNGHVDAILSRVALRGGDIKKAAQKIKDRPWMVGSGDDIATDAIMGLRPDESSGPWADMILRSDPFLKQASNARGLRGKRDLADRSNARSGFAAAGRWREAELASNPESVLRREAIEKIDKTIEGLDKMAQNQERIFKVIDDFLSPGGSFETQMVRAMRDRDRVIQGDQ